MEAPDLVLGAYAYREPLCRVTVTLPESYIEQLRRYGDANLSEGIHLLVEETHTSTGRLL